MNRIVAIVIFVVGLALLGAGIARVLPGATGPGGGIAFLGLVLIGLSFVPRPEAEADSPDAPALTTAERLGGIFYEPARVFQSLRRRPYWGAAFLVLALSIVAFQVAFTQRLGAENIAGATIDKTIEGGFIPAERAADIREQALTSARLPFARVSGAINAVVGTFIVLLVLAGLYVLGALMLGGRLQFWQAFAIAVFAALPPLLLQNLISLLLLFLKAPDEIDPIKGQRGLARADLGLLFTPAEHPYLFVLGSAFSLFSLYSLWLTATGLHHGGDKISKGSAWGIAIALWLFGVLLALGAAALFPTFVT